MQFKHNRLSLAFFETLNKILSNFCIQFPEVYTFCTVSILQVRTLRLSMTYPRQIGNSACALHTHGHTCCHSGRPWQVLRLTQQMGDGLGQCRRPAACLPPSLSLPDAEGLLEGSVGSLQHSPLCPVHFDVSPLLTLCGKSRENGFLSLF